MYRFGFWATSSSKCDSRRSSILHQIRFLLFPIGNEYSYFAGLFYQFLKKILWRFFEAQILIENAGTGGNQETQLKLLKIKFLMVWRIVTSSETRLENQIQTGWNKIRVSKVWRYQRCSNPRRLPHQRTQRIRLRRVCLYRINKTVQNNIKAI